MGVDDIRPGTPFPLGATIRPGGVNFSIYSDRSTTIELLLFESADDVRPSRVITLDPRSNKTQQYWHVFVPGLASGQIYAYRAYGPFAPHKGMRFNHERTLLDPYARGIAIPE
ncbi:MAG TPA: hypothetical protein VK445_01525, partial [Dissulfurispiraceae bacterium]|nr:hypothetical protein [Dissulfurispiraceae bacterium]